MPIYEYRCQQCGTEFELLRSISGSDRDLVCPECGASEPSRKLSLFASSGGNASACSSSGST